MRQPYLCLALLLLAASAFGTTVNVASYGAKADNSTDNTSAFNSAVAAAGNGGTVQISNAGTYLLNTVSSSYDGIGTAVMLSQPLTVTCSPGVILKSTNTALVFAFTITSNSVIIGGAQGSGCTFDGTGGASIDANYQPNKELTNIVFSYNTVQNVTMGGQFGPGSGVFSQGYLANSHIDYNHFTNIWQGGYQNYMTSSAAFSGHLLQQRSLWLRH